MPSIVDKYGVETEPVGRVELDSQSIERTRDIIIVRMRDRLGLSFRDIGRIMNLSRSRVNKRYHAVPGDARRLYGSGELV